MIKRWADKKIMKIIDMDLGDITPYENNPRIINKKAIDEVAKSIERYGFQQPIVVDSALVIVVGHVRYQAAKQLGLSQAPCIIADDLTPDEIQQYRIADNKTGEFSKWADEMLREELCNMGDMMEFEMPGFDKAEIETMLGIADFDQKEEEEELPEAPKEPTTKTGDVWMMGDHRLMCGDSQKKEDVTRLFCGNKFELLFSSPPYSAQRDYHQKITDWDSLMRGVFGILEEFRNEGGNCIVNLGIVYLDNNLLEYYRGWVDFMKDSGWNYFDSMIWDKMGGHPIASEGRTVRSHELLFNFTKDAAAINKTQLVKQSVVRNDSISMRKKDNTLKVEKIMNINHTKHHCSVFSIQRSINNKSGHPAVFPVELPVEIIPIYTIKNNIVYDPFMGSGTTIIAGEQTGRIVYGMEIAPAYVDMAVARWQNLTGKTAVLENGDGRTIEGLIDASKEK